MLLIVVIDDKPKESVPEHDTQMSSIRWHLSEGFVVPFDSSTPPFVLFLTAMLIFIASVQADFRSLD